MQPPRGTPGQYPNGNPPMRSAPQNQAPRGPSNPGQQMPPQQQQPRPSPPNQQMMRGPVRQPPQNPTQPGVRPPNGAQPQMRGSPAPRPSPLSASSPAPRGPMPSNQMVRGQAPPPGPSIAGASLSTRPQSSPSQPMRPSGPSSGNGAPPMQQMPPRGSPMSGPPRGGMPQGPPSTGSNSSASSALRPMAPSPGGMNRGPQPPVQQPNARGPPPPQAPGSGPNQSQGRGPPQPGSMPPNNAPPPMQAPGKQIMRPPPNQSMPPPNQGYQQPPPPNRGMPPRQSYQQPPPQGYQQPPPTNQGMPPRPGYQQPPPNQGMPPRQGYPQPPPNQGYQQPPAAGQGMPPNQSYQQPSDPPAQKHRIDPSQIPRPVVSKNKEVYHARGHTVTMPPPASSEFVCEDEGCCNPRFIRPTLNHVPVDKQLAQQAALPFAAVICPLAELHEDERPIPLVDFGPTGPLRCTRCMAYVNSFTKFTHGGRKFICNICTLANDTPDEYYSGTDQNGRRRDVMERAELSRGSVDFIVPKTYTVRPPQEPIFVFVVDVSASSFKSGLANAALDSIKYLLPSLAQNARKKVGIVTFDSGIQYYRMDQASGISVCAMADVDDPCAPLPPDSWLVSMADGNAAQDKLSNLIDLIKTTFEDTAEEQAVSGAAFASAVDALQVIGGRIILLHSSAPRIGLGKLSRQENPGAYGSTSEVDLYTSAEDTPYSRLAKQCVTSHISLDVFSVANTYSSLADIGRVCELTGGRVMYLPQFAKELSSNRHHLTTSLQRLVDREAGYEAVLKVRVSAGVRVDRSYGSFYSPVSFDGYSVDEMEFSVIDQDRSVCVTLAHDESLVEGSDVHIQAALLYTRSDGLRCVRVHNLALQVDPLLSNVFRYADLDATCSVWQRMAARKFVDHSLMKSKPTAVKEQLVDDCVTVLYNYRKHCASSSSSGQLILPEALKLLPLYTLSTLKSRALRVNQTGNPPRGFIDVRADERVMMLGLLNSLPVEFAVSAVYPKLYSIHDMTEECATLDEDGHFVLPPQLPPTAEKLEEEGVFLVHSAMFCYLYVGPKVSSETLMALFGVEQVDTSERIPDIMEPQEGEQEDGLRDKLRSLVEYLNSTIPISQPLEILTKQDWRSGKFMSALVEDRTRDDVSYVEFLVQLHKKIQQHGR